LRGLDTVPDPLIVEMALSDVVGRWWTMPPPGGEDPEELFGGALVRFAKEQHSPLGLLVLRALAVVSPSQEVRDAAAAAAHSLVVRGVRQAPAVARIGRVRAGRCWVQEDAYGDQTTVVCEYSYGDQRHAVCVLVDHNLGGIAKQAFFVDEVDETVVNLRAQAENAAPMAAFREVDPGWARALLERACAATDQVRGDPVDPDFTQWRALLLARLRVMPEPTDSLAEPEPEPEPEPPTPEQPDALLRPHVKDLLTERAPEIDLPSYVEALLPEGQQRRTTKKAAPAPAKRAPSGRRAPTGAYQIKVSLRGAKPPIWRRLKVPASSTLADLHRIIQYAMGWDDYHLHAFDVGGTRYGIPDPELELRDEARARLRDVAPADGAKFRYEYDFGDGWEHDIIVEKILDEPVKQPVLLAGRRACPPEDCGGIWGYARLLEVLADPQHEEYEEMSTWVEDGFDPDALDVDGINGLLDVMRLGRKA